MTPYGHNIPPENKQQKSRAWRDNFVKDGNLDKHRWAKVDSQFKMRISDCYNL